MIYDIKLIEDYSLHRFEANLQDAIDSYQSGGCEVELQYDAERAYTCLVIAKRPNV